MKVYQGQLHNLYCNIAYAFQNDEFWSFCGLLQSDHEQIHMKWVLNYDKNCIKHFSFVSNNENTWVHYDVAYPKTCYVIYDTNDICTHSIPCENRMEM